MLTVKLVLFRQFAMEPISWYLIFILTILRHIWDNMVHNARKISNCGNQTWTLYSIALAQYISEMCSKGKHRKKWKTQTNINTHTYTHTHTVRCHIEWQFSYLDSESNWLLVFSLWNFLSSFLHILHYNFSNFLKNSGLWKILYCEQVTQKLFDYSEPRSN